MSLNYPKQKQPKLFKAAKKAVSESCQDVGSDHVCSDDEKAARRDIDEILRVIESQYLETDLHPKTFWLKMKDMYPHLDVSMVRKKLKRKRSAGKVKASHHKKLMNTMAELRLANAINKIATLKDQEQQVSAIEKLFLRWVRSKSPKKGSSNMFWSVIKNQLPDADIRDLQKKINQQKQNKKRRELTEMGVNRNGTIKETKRLRVIEQPTMTKTERKVQMEKKGEVFPSNQLPFLTRGWFYKNIPPLQQMNELLKAELLSSSSTTSNNSHHGVSLAKTVVSGGVHGNKAEGVSGSIHWNNALQKNTPLQLQILKTVGDIVQESFGHCAWFKRWMAFYEARPNLKKFLIPRTPCTSCWWSYDSRPFNLHNDWNTFDAAFLVCPVDIAGGNVIFTNPQGTRAVSVHMSPGKSICGRWALSDHCVAPLEDGNSDQFRFSLVFYFDRRIATGCYKECYISHVTENALQLDVKSNAVDVINEDVIFDGETDFEVVSDAKQFAEQLLHALKLGSKGAEAIIDDLAALFAETSGSKSRSKKKPITKIPCATRLTSRSAKFPSRRQNPQSYPSRHADRNDGLVPIATVRALAYHRRGTCA